NAYDAPSAGSAGGATISHEPSRSPLTTGMSRRYASPTAQEKPRYRPRPEPGAAPSFAREVAMRQGFAGGHSESKRRFLAALARGAVVGPAILSEGRARAAAIPPFQVRPARIAGLRQRPAQGPRGFRTADQGLHPQRSVDEDRYRLWDETDIPATRGRLWQRSRRSELPIAARRISCSRRQRLADLVCRA